jgi:TolA-binding protein/ferric-dicitrate binding protein FerR (iron transport regulator)
MNGTTPQDEAFACLRKAEPTIDDLHSARVWAGIESKLGEHRRRVRSWKFPLAFGAGGAAVALLMLLVWPGARPRADRTAKATSPSTVPENAQPEASVAISAYLVSGTAPVELLDGKRSRIDVPTGGLVRAMVADDAWITLLGPAALTVLANDAQALVLTLDRGVLLCDWNHRWERKLRVRSLGTETVVVGTLFAIEAAAGGTRVSVARGKVTVVNDGRTMPVAAGRSLASGDGAPVPLSKSIAELLAEHDATVRPADGISGVLSVSADSNVGPVWIGHLLLGTPPLAARLPSGPTQVLLGPDAGQPRANGSRVRRVDTIVLPGKTTLAVAENGMAAFPSYEKTTPRPDRQGRVQAESRTQRRDSQELEASNGLQRGRSESPAGESPAALYDDAEARMRTGDVVGAKRSLQSLVERFPQERVANTARYELARLAFADGDWESARQQLERLGRTDVAPSLAEPAHYLRCRVEVASKRRVSANACLASFLKQFPDSPHGSEVLALLASFRLEESCESARPFLDEYLRRYPNGSFAGDAQTRRAECDR